MLVRNKFNNPGRGSDAKMNRLNPTSPIESSNKSVNSYLNHNATETNFKTISHTYAINNKNRSIANDSQHFEGSILLSSPK